MQRRYSEPNTYIDAPPSIPHNSDDLYDDVASIADPEVCSGLKCTQGIKLSTTKKMKHSAFIQHQIVFLYICLTVENCLWNFVVDVYHSYTELVVRVAFLSILGISMMEMWFTVLYCRVNLIYQLNYFVHNPKILCLLSQKARKTSGKEEMAPVAILSTP